MLVQMEMMVVRGPSMRKIWTVCRSVDHEVDGGDDVKRVGESVEGIVDVCFALYLGLERL